MSNLGYHLRREGTGLRTRIGIRVVAVHFGIVAVFGVIFPWMRGIGFLEPVMISAYACLGVLFAGPAAAQAFGTERPQSMSEALARILLAVCYGEFMAVVILLAGLMTVYTTRHFLFAPDLETLAMAELFGVAASVAVAAIAGWITLHFSAGAARQAMRGLFLLLLVVFFYQSGWLPSVAGEGALFSLAIAAVAFVALRQEIESTSRSGA